MLLGDGHLSSIRDLCFSADSRRLFSASLDKRVLIWALVRDREGGLIRAAIADRVWWEIAREIHGSISAMDYCPATGELVIGGVSARGGAGDLAVLRSDNGHLVRLLPPEDRPEDVATGHSRHVSGVAFSPSGRRLASTDVSGEVRLWSGDRGWSSILLARSGRDRPDEPRCAVFVSKDELVFSQLAEEPQKVGMAYLWFADLGGGGSPVPLSESYVGGVFALAADYATGRWAVSDGIGRVQIWSDRQKLQEFSLNAQGGKTVVAADLAFGPGDTILIGAAMEGERGLHQDWLELRDARSGTRLDAVGVGQGSYFTMAISPDRRIVAASDNSTNSLRIFELSPDGRRFVRRADGRPRSLLLPGSAFPIQGVAFSDDDSLRLALTRDPSTPAEIVVDLKSGEPCDGAGIRWRDHNAFAGEWSLDLRPPPPGSRIQTVQLGFRGTPRCQIQFDTELHGMFQCHAWIPDETGRTFAVALGTARNAIFVYRLVNQGICPMLRYYRDHADWITSLSVDRNSKFLASGSRDGTVKLWSLDGLSKHSPHFQQAAAWGAEFSVHNGHVVVSSLASAGIAANRNFQLGDVVTRYTRVVTDANGAGRNENYERADAILAALEQTSLLERVLVVISRNGQEQLLPLMVPAWEPVATLFLDWQGDWVIWTPLGYYNASVSGDKELVGWIINRARGQTPSFYNGSQFRELMEKPELIRGLFRKGNIIDALGPDEAHKALERHPILDAAARLPTLDILTPVSGSSLDPVAESRLVARIEHPGGAAPLEVKAFVNDVPLGDPAAASGDASQGRFQYAWQFKPNADVNEIKVRAWLHDRPGSALFAEDSATCYSPTKPARLRVHLLGIGAGTSYVARPLQFPVNDILEMAHLLEAKSGTFYELDEQRDILLDETPEALHQLLPSLARNAFPATRQGSIETRPAFKRADVERLIDRVADRLRNATSDDLLVVVLAGHGGASAEGEFYFFPPDPDLASGNPKELSVSWKAFLRLAALPCHKLFLLDSCQAGAAAHWKAAIRPLDALETLVVAAARADEESRDYLEKRHGYFTYHWLEALLGDADGRGAPSQMTQQDGNISLAEAIVYVEEEVPKHRAEIRSDQHPVHAPRKFSPVVYLPFVRWDARDRGGIDGERQRSLP